MKKAIAFLLVLLIPVGFAAAQENSGFGIFSFDIGVAPLYRLSDNENDNVTTFGLNLRVAEPLVVGFGLYDGGLTLLNLKYEVLSSARILVSLGGVSGATSVLSGGTGAVGGLGFEYAPFRRKISGLATEFKMGVQYLFLTNSIDEGSLLFTLGFSVGI